MGPRLTIKIDEKRFGDGAPLFTGFGLTVEPSSIVAVVGPSGVGKSTLLRLVAGIDTDYAGQVAFDAVASYQAKPPGFVFQDPRLLPWRTALENLAVARPDLPVERAANLLASVGLAGSEQAFPHQLSGGMQRRVALARAVLVNPDLWLFDEPFTSLDRPLVEGLQALILTMIEAQAPTVVFVTHTVEDAARLATRVVVLAGRPATIAADIALDSDPARRSADEAKRYVQMIEAST